MSRKAISFVLVLAAAAMAVTACDPCPSCPVVRVTPTPTATVVPPTATQTATPAPTQTATAAPTQTATPALTQTATATQSATPSPTPTATKTPTPRPTSTPTATPSRTATPTRTGTPVPTATATPFGPGSFKGSYSLRFFGKTGSGRPDASSGLVISDGVSTITGTLTENKNGVVCEFKLNGTYTINPNGTGSIIATTTAITPGCAGSTSIEASVLVNAGNGEVALNISGRGAMLGTLTKQ